MEDIRTLLTDREAEIAPECLAYQLRGLTAALTEHLRDGPPEDSGERLVYNEVTGALAWSADFHAILLAHWMVKHVDECLNK